jgi:PEP-CTERM motif-containing protein
MVRHLGTVFAIVLCLLLCVSFAGANSANPPVLLSFQGLQDGQLLGNVYNTPFFGGVTFSSNIFVSRPTFEGGSGNFAPDPTGTPAIFISGTPGSSVNGSINVANGITTGINFFYTAAFRETVTIWSGANGTGLILATMNLSANDSNCSTVAYCNWTNVAMSFSGTAGSVTFSGPANGIGLADITLNQTSTAVPEPSSMYLLGTGIIGFCAQNMRRFIKA